MSGLILCREKMAKNPYYIHIKGISVHVYSIEELCYCLYHNVELVDESIMSLELCNFLHQELGRKELASLLRGMIAEKGSLQDFLITLFSESGYYTEEELKEPKGILEILQSSSKSEKLNRKAEKLLAKKRYLEALHDYCKILQRQKEEKMSEDFYGKIYHNMGVIYGRMFLYEEAAECFEKSYALLKRPETNRQYRACLELLNGTDNMSMQYEGQCEKLQETEALFQLKEEGNVAEYYEKLEQILSKWKTEYRNSLE